MQVVTCSEFLLGPFLLSLFPFYLPCSFSLFLFALLVPFFSAYSFFASKGNTPPSACIFFIYLVSFLPKTSLKKDATLCFSCTLPCAFLFILFDYLLGPFFQLRGFTWSFFLVLLTY